MGTQPGCTFAGGRLCFLRAVLRQFSIILLKKMRPIGEYSGWAHSFAKTKTIPGVRALGTGCAYDTPIKTEKLAGRDHGLSLGVLVGRPAHSLGYGRPSLFHVL